MPCKLISISNPVLLLFPLYYKAYAVLALLPHLCYCYVEVVAIQIVLSVMHSLGSLHQQNYVRCGCLLLGTQSRPHAREALGRLQGTAQAYAKRCIMGPGLLYHDWL
jgi:hypothetical protein